MCVLYVCACHHYFWRAYGEDVIVSAVTVDGCACVLGVYVPILYHSYLFQLHRNGLCAGAHPTYADVQARNADTMLQLNVKRMEIGVICELWKKLHFYGLKKHDVFASCRSLVTWVQ